MHHRTVLPSILFVVLALCSLVPAAPAVVGADAAAADVHRSALRFLGYMGTDPDEQSKLALKFHSLVLAKGDVAMAERLHGFMGDWRRTVALYELSARLSGQGDATEGAARFRLAESSPFQGETDAQTGRVLQARAAAEAAAGGLQEARATLEKIAESHRRADALAGILRYADKSNLGPLLLEIELLEYPEVRRKGWNAAGDIHAAAGDKEKALEYFRRSLEDAEKNNNATTIAEVEPLVGKFLALDDAASAKRAAALCLAFCGRTAPEAGWKARDMVLAATAMRAIGDAERAGVLLSEIPKTTGKTDLFQFVEFGGWAARAFLVSGEPEKFERAMRDVVVIGRKHDHHRARAMAVLQVLAMLVETERPLPEMVATEFDKTAESIEKDPHYNGPRGL